MTRRTAADEFISGKPAVYTGFNGELLVATFSSGERNRLGAPQLQIQNARGRVIRDIIYSEVNARSFFWNLDAVAA